MFQWIWQVVFSAAISGAVVATLWEEVGAHPPIWVSLSFLLTTVAVLGTLRFVRRWTSTANTGLVITSTVGDASQAASGIAGGDLVGGDKTTAAGHAIKTGDLAVGATLTAFGNNNAIVLVDGGEPRALQVVLREAVATAESKGGSKSDVLTRLAQLRSSGVDVRNRLIFARGDDAKERVNAAYSEWLEAATQLVAEVNTHEAIAFRTLDRFSMSAAPDGAYQSPVIHWLIAMFSTHLDRIEEIRKRYSQSG
jgi:hypothetical protein